MKLTEVKDKKTRRQFLEVPYGIYKDDSNWIAPLEKDIETVFDLALNTAFQNGEAIRWVLQDPNGNAIGRVAAFIQRDKIVGSEYPCGGMGFFECANNTRAATMLFEACRNWLLFKGMKAMEGPVNFGERDKFWGLLSVPDGSPTYQEAYNPPYYKQLFEDYGFREYFRQHTFSITRQGLTADRLGRIAERVMRKPGYEFRHLEMDKLDKYVADFVEIYNAAWSKFENFKPVAIDTIYHSFNELRPFMEPEFIWFAYVEGKPAGFIVMLPDFNQLLRHLSGKLDLKSKLKFLFFKKLTKVRKLKGLVFGVVPEYHNHGLDATLIHCFFGMLLRTPQYQVAELAWVGDFNPKMQSLMQNIGGSITKEHITYRKLFDESIDFKPFSLGEYNKEA